jgi:hypothetical protein
MLLRLRTRQPCTHALPGGRTPQRTQRAPWPRGRAAAAASRARHRRVSTRHVAVCVTVAACDSWQQPRAQRTGVAARRSGRRVLMRTPRRRVAALHGQRGALAAGTCARSKAESANVTRAAQRHARHTTPPRCAAARRWCCPCRRDVQRAGRCTHCPRRASSAHMRQRPRRAPRRSAGGGRARAAARARAAGAQSAGARNSAPGGAAARVTSRAVDVHECASHAARAWCAARAPRAAGAGATGCTCPPPPRTGSWRRGNNADAARAARYNWYRNPRVVEPELLTWQRSAIIWPSSTAARPVVAPVAACCPSPQAFCAEAAARCWEA